MHFKRNNKQTKLILVKKFGKEQKIIPGGTMLFKNPDLFLPNKWPAYFKKAKDVRFGI